MIFLQQASVPELQLLVGILVVLGSGVTSWVGVKVALAELRGENRAFRDKLDALEKRVDRIESRYFKE